MTLSRLPAPRHLALVKGTGPVVSDLFIFAATLCDCWSWGMIGPLGLWTNRWLTVSGVLTNLTKIANSCMYKLHLENASHHRHSEQLQGPCLAALYSSRPVSFQEPSSSVPAAEYANSSTGTSSMAVPQSASCPVGQMHIFFRLAMPGTDLNNLDALADAALHGLHAQGLLLPSDCLQV